MSIQRYDMELPDLEQGGKMEPRTEGEYVRFEDHEKALAEAQRELKESQESADSVCEQLGRAIYDRDRFFADLEVNRSALSEIAKMLNIGNPFIAGFIDEARIEIAKLKASVIVAKQSQEMADFLTTERDRLKEELDYLRKVGQASL